MSSTKREQTKNGEEEEGQNNDGDAERAFYFKRALHNENGQTTIPKQIRQYLGVGSGDEVKWVVKADGTIEFESV